MCVCQNLIPDRVGGVVGRFRRPVRLDGNSFSKMYSNDQTIALNHNGMGIKNHEKTGL